MVGILIQVDLCCQRDGGTALIYVAPFTLYHKPLVLERRLLAPTRWRHGDTALMCVATSQIGYSWIMRPSTLPSSYVRFLNRHGGAPLSSYKAVRVCPSCVGAASGYRGSCEYL